MAITVHSAATRRLTPVRCPVWTSRRGTGEDVLLLAGLGEDADAFGPLADRLARRYRVTTYDARGTGLSPVPPGPWRIGDFVADALAVLDHYGIEHAHLVGASIGAITAQELAAAHPARVRSLVLDGTWLRPDVHLQLELGRVTMGVRQAPYFADRRGFAASARALRRYDAGDRLRAIDAPALITVGEGRGARGLAHARAVAGQIRGSRVELVEGAGRRPYVERPEAYGRLVERFVTAAADTVEERLAA
jgi:pimeloyl-ACP methyl ester carboxylesterase